MFGVVWLVGQGLGLIRQHSRRRCYSSLHVRLLTEQEELTPLRRRRHVAQALDLLLVNMASPVRILQLWSM